MLSPSATGMLATACYAYVAERVSKQNAMQTFGFIHENCYWKRCSKSLIFSG